MKKYGILLFFFTLSLFVEAGADYLYRVHVGSYKREETPKDIRTIPNLKKYVLPEGYYCFFSGGYYIFFEGALRQLKEVHAKGFKHATIRVFKNQKLLPVVEGLDKIEEESINPAPIPTNQPVEKQIYSVDGKKTLRNRADLYREIIMPELTDTTNRDGLDLDLNMDLDLDLKLRLKKIMNFGFGKKSGDDDNDADKNDKDTSAEIKEENEDLSLVKGANASTENEEADENKSDNDEIAQSTETSTSSDTDGSETSDNGVTSEETTEEAEEEYDEALLAAIEEGMVEEEAESVIEENDEKMELSDQFIPTEKPIFKVYLTSTKQGMDTPMRIKYVPDIVYTYEKKDLTLFTVGYYETSAEASADLARYQSEGFYNAKIIGLYKTIIVSQKIADEILLRVNNAK